MEDPHVGNLGRLVVERLDDVGHEIQRLGRPADHDGVRLLVGGRHHLDVHAAAGLAALALALATAVAAAVPAPHLHHHLEGPAAASAAVVLAIAAAALRLLLEELLISVAVLVAFALVRRKTRISATDAMCVSRATTICIRRLMLAVVSVMIRALPSSLASMLAYSGRSASRFVLQSGRRHVADGDHVRHDVVAGDDRLRVPARQDGEVLLLGVRQRHDLERLAREDRGQIPFPSGSS